MKRRYRLFSRFLLSYFVILIVPIALFFNFVMARNLDRLKLEITKSAIQNLYLVKSRLDSELGSVFNASMQVSLNPLFRRQEILTDTFTQREVVRLLRSYVFPTSAVYEIFLFFPGKDLVLSSSSSYTRASLLEAVYRFPHWTYDATHEALPSGGWAFAPAEMVTINVADRSRLIPAVMRPELPIIGDARIVVFLDASRIDGVLQRTYAGHSGFAMIVDGDGQILTSVGSSDTVGQLVADMQLPTTGEGSESRVVVEGRSYLVHVVASDVFDLRLVSAVDESSVLADFESSRIRSLQTIAGILVLGGVLISGLMLLNYRPINRFLALAERIFRRELDARHPLQDVAGETLRLSQSAEDNRLSQRDTVVAALLRGNAPEPGQAVAAGIIGDDSEAQSWENGVRFAVVVVDIARNPISVRASTLVAALEFESLWEGMAKQSVDERRIVAIYRRSKLSGASPRDLGEEVMERLNTYAISASIAVGDVIDSVARIPESYSHALEALEHRIMSDSPLLVYEEQPLSDATYPSHLVETLSSSLASGHAEEASEAFDTIFTYAEVHSLPTFTVRALCFDCVQCLAAAYDRVETPIPTVPRIGRDDTLADFVARFRTALSGYFAVREEWRAARDADRGERLRRYVNDNFDDPSFCLQQMADVFSMSPSNLSHQFKSSQGVTLADYTKRLRLEKAKRLLVHTGMAIAEIVQDIGYSNTSSFVRTFKDSYAMTPGQYRRRFGGS